MDESVAVVALPPVHWCSGALIDLHAVAARISQLPPTSRPLFIVDGTQSLGAAAFNVHALNADFLACSVHKWLNCPYGMSLVYVHPRHHSTWLPLDQHERGRVGSNEEGWDEIIFMDKETGFYPDPFFPDARRFDAGGKANPVTVPMVRAGLESVLRIGAENVERCTRALTNSVVQQLQSIFGEHLLVREETQRSAHILGVRFHPTSPLHAAVSLVELNARLKQERVFASVRGEWLRLSLYVHNTPADVRRFVSLFTLTAQDMLLSHGGGMEQVSVQARTVLVTGGAGWLAQSVCESLLQRAFSSARPGPQYHIHVTYNTVVPHWVPAERRHRLDLADQHAATELIQRLKPDTVIHAAALSSPLVCHKDAHRAHEVNCPTALIDAVHAHVSDCLFLFTSTDMVYGGERAPYRVENTSADTTTAETPANVYGQSKLACEQAVRRLRYGTVLRLSNMIGELFVAH
jgi:aspartate aminotransferase-like enzyme